MKLKLDDNGHAVLQDGKPVYIHDDGKEVAFDAVGTVATISRLNAEARDHRVAKEGALEQLKAFEGIADPAAARKALETLSNLDQKRLVDAGQVEQANLERDKAWQIKLDAANQTAAQFEQQLYGEKIGGSFARSTFISEKLAVPADMIQAAFGNRFKVESGQTVAYDAQGNKIFSRSRPGELASFDEALEVLVDQYPNKDHIMKPSGQSGGGAVPGAGQQQGARGNMSGDAAERANAIAAKFPELARQ